MVDYGMVEIDGGKILIREKATGEVALEIPFLTIPPFITYRKFRSANRNYIGGRVELVGYFGRQWQELIIMKMNLETFYALRDDIQGALYRAGLSL